MSETIGQTPEQQVDAIDADQSQALQSLLQRMRSKTGFPALSESVCRIQSMASSERESVGSLTNEILKDVALTHKLLRLVNSALYARGGGVGTVSRAVSLVGFVGIRNMAMSLLLLEHMPDKSNAQLLKEEFLRALMAGSIAAELGVTAAEGEEAFIGALFQNLGRMLSQFYFPEEAAGIRALMNAPHDALSEDVASKRVLGISFAALGLGVCTDWGLPDTIQRCLVKPTGDPPSYPPKEASSRLRWSTRAANEMADAMLHADANVVDVRLTQLSKRYEKSLGLSFNQIHQATLAARAKLSALAQAMDITLPVGSPAARLLAQPGAAAQAPPAPGGIDTLLSSELRATLTAPATGAATPSTPGAAAVVAADQAAQTLTAGIQDITNAMVEDFSLSDVLRMILEAMFRALDFQRVVLCLRDPKSDTLIGRFGLGLGVETVVKRFHVDLRQSGAPDLFATICHKGADTLISDASEARIAARLPLWYRQDYHAATFLILPLQLKGRPFGLIYADKAAKSSLLVSERELSLLRTLRNQAVMAFKQSS